MKFNVIQPEEDNAAGIFLEIAELIFFSIRELGYEAVISRGEAKSQYRNIVIGIFHSENVWDHLPDDSIVINTEPLFARLQFISWSERLVELSSKYLIWDYDPRNIEILFGLGVKNTQLFSFGYQKELERIPNYPDSERPIDVLFYGSSNERRSIITNQLISNGLVYNYLFGTYGNPRDECISRSKMVINLHFNETGVFEIIRVHYLLNNGVAIVPEIGPDTSIDQNYLNFLVGVPYSELVQRCLFLKENPEELLDLRFKALNEFKKVPQSTYMEQLLKNI